MATLHVATSSAVPRHVHRKIRAMLDEAFDGDFTDDDWDHATGGLHVWLTVSRAVISHASLVERTLVCGDHHLRVGYVEAVATAAAFRHRGHGLRVMRHIGAQILDRFPLGTLSTGAYAFYAALGWERWRGPTFVDGPDGRERTARDDGDILILRTARTPSLDLDQAIVCDWRAGDVW